MTPQTSPEQPFTLQQMAPKRRRTWLPVVIAAAILAAAGFAGYALTRPEPAAPSSSPETALINACRDAVRPKLKAPSTAQFPGGERTEQVGDTFRVFGSVDAQNGFGAMIRSDYRCVLSRTGDTWSVYRVDFP